MNKYAIVAILCLSFLAGCTNFEKTAEKTSTLVSFSDQPRDKDQIKKSVVKITSQGRQGTGFIVGLTSNTAYILTVSHVVASDPTPNVEFFGQTKEFKARILGIEGQQENGFALLTVTGAIPTDAIPLHVDNKFDLKSGDSVFTFGFPRSGGNWAYDDLSYSSRISREILFSGSDIKEGNSGSPLIKGDEVVGMVTSVTDFAHANSSVSIIEFLQGVNGGSVVLGQMEKWGINWREAYDKHLKEKSMLAEQQRIAAEKAAAAKEAEIKQKQQRLAEKIAAAKEPESKQKDQTVRWQNPSSGTQYEVTTQSTQIINSKDCREYETRAIINGKQEEIYGYACRQPDNTWQEEIPTIQDKLKDGSFGPEMVRIPTGTFQMGSNDGEDDEKPVHTVSVKSFYMGKYEVTFEEYDKFCEATGQDKPSDQGWGRGKRPVVSVDWGDAKAYAQWLSEQTGKNYRLPSEAQWEYACRAGTATKYWWGNEIGKNNANCDGCSSQWDNKQTAPVGSFKQNPFGLYDMHGNALEWLEDVWHDSYSGAPNDGSVWISGGSLYRHLLRGGSWYHSGDRLRCAYRSWYDAPYWSDNRGFRISRM